ncbi:MAG: hypothetical protein ACM3JL_01090 [Nitrososphaerota archaeon]
MLGAQVQVGEDSDLLFTTPNGCMWRQRNFYRDLWRPAQEASGLDIRPTSAATATSRTYEPPASTMPTWPRSQQGSESRRCWRGTPNRCTSVSTQCAI